MNILVTGGDGQLARCIKDDVAATYAFMTVKELDKSKNNHYFFKNRDEVDITNPSMVEDYVKKNNIDVIINCAAYTNVENAETNEGSVLADKVNFFGPRKMADICKKYDITLIHISTDFVFGGEKNKPYNENDGIAPLNVYGLTKARAETIAHFNPNTIIIRTSWLYSEYCKNFFKTMLERVNKGLDTKVINDQIGTPTYARDLAEFIVYLVEKTDLKTYSGTYHFSNEGECSWYDFAHMIEMLTTGCNRYIKPCATEDFPCKAVRPKYSVLSKDKIREVFGYKPRLWTDALFECIQNNKSTQN